MRALIVVPTYNEIENIQPITEAILRVTPKDVEILVVDDGSPDGTGELVDSLAKNEPRIHVLHRDKKMGLGRAYVAGFRWGMEKDYEVFFTMDADFSHDPKYLPTMLELIRSNDVVIGSRYVEGGGTLNWGLGRKVLSRGGSLYARTILGAPLRDFTGGFNAFKREVLQALNLDSLRSDGYSFQIELKYRSYLKGFRLQEFPIIFEDRKVGQSKMNQHIIIEALQRVWGLRLGALKEGHGLLGRLIGGHRT
ncbi:MAG TPA: polyprenol monophosphomannose synthase [Bdellovibrionota bacterium]|jgi:dolichol-phosphate mannosyltransferase|nr:polyprenol monophosphomannose synthase [Bdellovibrionota bacterium]